MPMHLEAAVAGVKKAWALAIAAAGTDFFLGFRADGEWPSDPCFYLFIYEFYCL
jgi:hypothetical protein